jgi:hypothetical protein
MVNINEIFQGDYLKAYDFGGIEGRPVLATINHVTLETMNDNSQKICLHLREYEKGILLNKTNATVIASYAGSDTDDWNGKQVVIYVAMVEFQGKSTEGIRLRQPKPQPIAAKPVHVAPQPAQQYAPPAGHPALDDEVPF